MKKDTRLGHAGRKPDQNFGIVNPPVYHASTVTFPTVAAMHGADRFHGVYYGRYGTPTTFAFEEAVAVLEGGDACIATSSGLAAIVGAILPFVAAGDHVLMIDNVYAPSRKFCDSFLKRFGVATTYYDPQAGTAVASLMRPNTKVVFAETPGSLTFEVPDIPALAEIAHAGGAKLILDNTWSAGYYFQPFAHGVDVSVQAATKYIVGHSDAMMGTITTRAYLYETIKDTVAALGYAAAPDDCYLALRGLRTLGVRMAQHQASALKIAHWLAGRPEVARVLHPALPDCPGHDIWKRDFTGASGLFGVELAAHYGHDAMAAFLDNLSLFAMGYSWGGYESLIIPANPSAIRTATEWHDRGSLIRLQIGLEDPDDLIADLALGLDRLTTTAAE